MLGRAPDTTKKVAEAEPAEPDKRFIPGAPALV